MSKNEKVLNVSPDLSLPLDAVTQSIALLAVRRAGKSNAAAVIAEEMFKAGLPWVAIDPKGDWWGLRSSRDGTGPGLHVPIFGGLHGDMPLAPEAGKLIAELIADENLTCVLDVSEFASKAAQMRFLADLGEHLFRLHGKQPQPRHLFLEEADDFVPQRVMREQARCVGAWTKLVKQGGSRGLGVSLISQRSAVVNKDALTQVETLIALRTTSPQDRKAISEWVSYHDVARELVDSLPGLDDGEAWVCSPHWLGRYGQPAIQKMRFRQRSTFDSGATPTVSQKRRTATLADIDLGALAGRMEQVAEKAAQDDPSVLRRKIAGLEKRLRAAAPTADEDRLAAENTTLRRELQAAQNRPPERVEVSVLTPGDVAAIEQAITGLRDVAATLELALSRVSAASAPKPTRQPTAVPVAVPLPARAGDLESAPANSEPNDPKPLVLGKPHRALLTVLAQFPDGRTDSQLAMLSGYSTRPAMMKKALGQLRSAGFIEPGRPFKATAPGIGALEGEYEELPTGPELLDAWLERLGGAEGAFLKALIDAWPGSLTKDQIADMTGYSDRPAMLKKALGRLRTLELIEGHDEMRADETLAGQAVGVG